MMSEPVTNTHLGHSEIIGCGAWRKVQKDYSKSRKFDIIEEIPFFSSPLPDLMRVEKLHPNTLFLSMVLKKRLFWRFKGFISLYLIFLTPKEDKFEICSDRTSSGTPLWT